MSDHTDAGLQPIKWSDFEPDQPDTEPGPHLCPECGRWIPCRHCEVSDVANP